MSLIIAVHIFASVFLICLVLLQSGKGSDLGAALGGGSSSQSVFGTRRGNVLTKATTILATIFMVTSLTITVLKSHPTSIIKGGGQGISEEADTQAEVLKEEVKEEVEKPEGEPVSEKAEPMQVKPVMIEPAKKEEPKKEAPRTKEEVPVKKEETKEPPSAGQESPAPTVKPQTTTPKEEAQPPGETSKEPPLEESPKQEPPSDKD